MRTFLKWQGNKSRYIKFITPHVPTQIRTYIEPFIGSGALFLSLAPKRWIINDLNADLISAWKLVQEDTQFIEAQFKRFAKRFCTRSRESKLSLCKTMTDALNTTESGHEKTINYMLMLHCCYMGVLYKANRFFFYGLDSHIYCDNKCFFLKPSFYENIHQIHDYLNTSSRGHIMQGDYRKALSKARKGDFVFLDPPYKEDHLNYNFHYNANEHITDTFLDELLHQVQKLDSKEVKWIMTQADTPQVRQVFSAYTMIEFPVFRTKTRTHKNELLIKNYE